MKNIIVFTSSELGGAEYSLTRMALASPAGFYQLATLDGEGPWCDWVRYLGKTPLVFGARYGVAHGRIKFRAIMSLIRYVLTEDIQVVYVCGLRASLWLRILKPFMPRVKLVHGIRTDPSSNLRSDIVFRFIERWLNWLVDLYIVNSKVAAITLTQKCGVAPEQIQLIYNGIPETAKNVIPIVKRPLHVLTVANLTSYKGHVDYLFAIEIVLEKIPDAKFIFIGRDDMEGEVQSKIAERHLSQSVFYLGFQRDVSSWLSLARLMVLPSTKEGCPTSVLEAMAYGVPVVGYEAGGLPELVRHGDDGLLVPVADRNALAMSIIDLLEDTDISSKMSASCLQRSASDFKLEICVEKHYQSIKMLGRF